MKKSLFIAIAMILGLAVAGRSDEPAQHAGAQSADMPQAVFQNYDELKWNKIIPDLATALQRSPSCTSILKPMHQAPIRSPKALHVRKHWHSANETHTIILARPPLRVMANASSRVPARSIIFRPGWCTKRGFRPEGWRSSLSTGAWDVNWVEGAPTAPISRNSRVNNDSLGAPVSRFARRESSRSFSSRSRQSWSIVRLAGPDARREYRHADGSGVHSRGRLLPGLGLQAGRLRAGNSRARRELALSIRRVEIPFDQLHSVGMCRRTVRGLPGSANGIWFERLDGSTLIFPIESNVEQACTEIARHVRPTNG